MRIPPDSPVVTNTSPPTLPQTIVIPPDGGTIFAAYGDTAQVKLDGAQTNGSMAVAVSTTPPGGGRGTHP
ncbi:MAG: hypothetical protein JO069_15470 [Verrucomicrobia bacterium]|nr:hypothetical protein [Verrucomicrobiota bacterium]